MKRNLAFESLALHQLVHIRQAHQTIQSFIAYEHLTTTNVEYPLANTAIWSPTSRPSVPVPVFLYRRRNTAADEPFTRSCTV